MEPTKLITDEELMNRVKLGGDRDAFSLLMGRHKAHAFRLAMQWTGDYDDAMDAAQEAFVKCYAKASRYETGRPFWPWFAAILRNTARTLRRGRIRRRKAGDEHAAGERADARAAAAEGARYGELLRQLSSLPPKWREVLVLRHLEGMNYREIAAVLKVPENTVASRLHAARRELGKRYGQ